MTADERQERVLHLIGNSHIDPVWLWQWPEGYQEIRATFRSALDLMNEYPELIFTCDSAAYYEWIEEIDPQMFAEIQSRVAEGRWEIVGGWWVEPDCNLPSGESFVRHGLISQRYFFEKFGRIATVGYNVDPFGHNAMLPQILRKSGMDAYVFMRPGPHEKALPSPIFRWRSPDGSEVLAFRLPHEYCSSREDLGYHLDKSLAQLPARWVEMMAFYGVGNHGGGPTRENLESIRRLDGVGTMPRLVHSTPRRFFDAIVASGRELPVVEDELQHHAVGCYSAHSGIKRWMRRAENELGRAEVWSTVARTAVGASYPADELRRAWKDVLFNQFHDTLGGTAIEPAYRDARDQLGEASSIAARAENLAIQSISRAIDLPRAPGVTPIVVFNPHAWPVRTLAEMEFGMLRSSDGLIDESGAPLPLQQIQSYATVLAGRSRLCFEVDLPPLGYRTYRVAPDSPRPDPGTLRADASTLENEHVRLTLDPATGEIASLVLREDGRDIADLIGPGSRVAVVADTSDTWSHRMLAYRDEVGRFEATSPPELIETGPVRALLRVDRAFRGSRCTIDYILGANASSIEMRVILDWREKSHLAKVRVATAIDAETAWFEIPYGAIERRASGDEEPGQRWVDVSGPLAGTDSTLGLAVLNDSKYGFDVVHGEIGVTAVRSPIYAHHEPRVPQPGVRFQFQDIGIQRFTLSLLPHRGTWADAGLARAASELNQRPTLLMESAHPGRLPQMARYGAVTPENLVLGAVKVAEDEDDLVIRLVETAGRATRAVVDLPLWQRRFETDIGPFEIRTFRVSRDPDVEVVETDLLERPMAAAEDTSPRRPEGTRQDARTDGSYSPL
ncbi:MAG TPA: glycoside hydrolase family 38 C-terminal domain-containing protein, partial [Candidatus Limnocylindrales bacterium]|nr:glycoside hydrolase family 38 C-terminal domain-containing protein [Candidatus Limnocylindrales bacterium]